MVTGHPAMASEGASLRPSACSAEVLGGPRILQQLIRPLQQVGQQVAAGGQLDWRTAESALYCIRWGWCTASGCSWRASCCAVHSPQLGLLVS